MNSVFLKSRSAMHHEPTLLDPCRSPRRQWIGVALMFALVLTGGTAVQADATGDRTGCADCVGSQPSGVPAYAIHGTVTGLAGSGLVLVLNDDESVPVPVDGSFSFATSLGSGSAYAVTIGQQPTQPTQMCVLFNESGIVGTSHVDDVVVHCGAAITYTVGGTLDGLAASTSVGLTVNAGSELTLAADGDYVFPHAFLAGDGYTVSVTTQPDGQFCTVSRSEGVVAAVPISDVDVHCTAGGAELQLSVTDGGDFAAYGQVRDYYVTLSNVGDLAATDIAVAATFDGPFDVPSVQWSCLSGAPGVVCTPAGTSGFSDSATLPPGTSLVWVVRVPIRIDSVAEQATFTVTAHGATDAIDTNTLVIFRDGVDVPYGATLVATLGSTGGAAMILDDEVDVSVSVESPSSGSSAVLSGGSVASDQATSNVTTAGHAQRSHVSGSPSGAMAVPGLGVWAVLLLVWAVLAFGATRAGGLRRF